MPELPASVRVLGVDYRIQMVDASPFEDAYAGMVRFLETTILLRAGMQRDLTLETLLHEVLHVIDSATGEDLSEAKVRMLSRGILSVLRENPGLLQAVQALAAPDTTES